LWCVFYAQPNLGVKSTLTYFLLADRTLFRGAALFFRAVVLRVLVERLDPVSAPGVLMILRTAATRSELRPRISPISSGVGTALPIIWALMALV
jgi:hypothetical protein